MSETLEYPIPGHRVRDIAKRIMAVSGDSQQAYDDAYALILVANELDGAELRRFREGARYRARQQRAGGLVRLLTRLRSLVLAA